MKILINDLIKNTNAGASALYPADGYTALNVKDVYLDRLYISVATVDTVTIDFGLERPIDCIFLAGLNAASAQIVLKNGAGSTVKTINLETLRFVNSTYFDALAVRYIVISANVASNIAPWVDQRIDAGQYLRLRGVGAGLAYTVPGVIQNQFSLPSLPNADYTVSKTGQYLASQYDSLRTRSWPIRAMTFDEVSGLINAIKTLGFYVPTYFDMFDDTTGFDEPIYAVITEALEPARNGAEFDMVLKITEAR